MVTLIDLVADALRHYGVDPTTEVSIGSMVRIRPSPHGLVVVARSGNREPERVPPHAWILEIEL